MVWSPLYIEVPGASASVCLMDPPVSTPGLAALKAEGFHSTSNLEFKDSQHFHPHPHTHGHLTVNDLITFLSEWRKPHLNPSLEDNIRTSA